MKLLEGVIADAIISIDGRYRYMLTREWDRSLEKAVFIMLNPSTADRTTDDMTLRKCQEFARRWGFGGVEVVNLFALRATDPAELAHDPDPVGPLNDVTLAETFAITKGVVVAAWGHKGGHMDRDKIVMHMAYNAGRTLWRIGPPTPLRAMPRHPGRISYDLMLERHSG